MEVDKKSDLQKIDSDLITYLWLKKHVAYIAQKVIHDTLIIRTGQILVLPI